MATPEQWWWAQSSPYPVRAYGTPPTEGHSFLHGHQGKMSAPLKKGTVCSNSTQAGGTVLVPFFSECM